jgi:hypothetical protein
MEAAEATSEAEEILEAVVTSVEAAEISEVGCGQVLRRPTKKLEE